MLLWCNVKLLECRNVPLWCIKPHLYTRGISMLLEHLDVWAGTTHHSWALHNICQRGLLLRSRFFFGAQMVVCLHGRFTVWQCNLTCVGHVPVFFGSQSSLRLRGASVPFCLVVVWWRVVVGGFLAYLRLTVGRHGELVVLRIYWLGLHTHMHSGIPGSLHQRCSAMLKLSVMMHFRDHYVPQTKSIKTTLYCGRQQQWQILLSVVFKRHMWSPGLLGAPCLCFLSSDRWHSALKLAVWLCRMEPALTQAWMLLLTPKQGLYQYMYLPILAFLGKIRYWSAAFILFQFDGGPALTTSQSDA